jgi:hypothetical protein
MFKGRKRALPPVLVKYGKTVLLFYSVVKLCVDI